MKKIIIFFLLVATFAQAQLPTLSADFHQQRRETLREKMPENSVSVFVSNPQQKRSMSSSFKYKQNTDLYYLTGINEPNVVLFVFKETINFDNLKVNEILFVSPKDPMKELWDGIMLGEAGASKISGVDVVKPIKTLKDLSFIDANVSIAFGAFPAFEDTTSNKKMLQIIDLFTNKFTINNRSLQNWMNQLRGIKTSEEIAVMRRAILISGQGHIEAMKAIKPGISERQAQAVHEFTHRILGSDDVGYLSIIGAGNNACILHYHDNSKTNLQDGLILMDVGAEYLGYTGDITRTVPVNGKFKPEEKLIYQLVLDALEAGIAVAKNGATFGQIQKASRDVINQGLVELGITKKGENHNYFPHGIGHHLGLDVHDRGEMAKLQSGMIITIEPGIYIPENSAVDKKWWGIGVRIEDNILITESGNENLSEFVPKTIEAIEKIMGTSDLLDRVK